MRVAHFTVITPKRCGLYETTRELVAGLRGIGVDSRLVDPDKENNKLHPSEEEDRGAKISDLEWAKTADILVNHSGLGSYEKLTNQPIVHVCHGRPRYSFIGERDGGTPVYSYQYNKSKDDRYKEIVTFWKEHLDYHDVMWHPKKVNLVQPSVDLSAWTPNGPSGYKFGGKGGDKNIVITDAWREDIDPFIAINAFILYNRKYPGSKLHIYGHSENLRGWGALIQKLRDEDGMGELKPYINGLDNVYRAADLTLTPHTIAVRTVRESMACGCPILSVIDLDPERIRQALGADRQEIRKEAEISYNPINTARQFKAILDGAIR